MRKTILALLLVSPLIYASNWECINRNIGIVATCNTWRWSVPHGWLVSTDNGDAHISMAFYPDETHEWKV